MNIEQIARDVREEMADAILPQVVGAYEEAFLRRCLSKLAEQAGEPVAYQSTRNGFIAKENKNPEYNVGLYTEAHLIATQQRTAEACAKVCDDGAEKLLHFLEQKCAEKCAQALRFGEWREYL